MKHLKLFDIYNVNESTTLYAVLTDGSTDGDAGYSIGSDSWNTVPYKDGDTLKQLIDKVVTKAKNNGEYKGDIEDLIPGITEAWILDATGMKKVTKVLDAIEGGNDSEVYAVRSEAKEVAFENSVKVVK